VNSPTEIDVSVKTGMIGKNPISIQSNGLLFLDDSDTATGLYVEKRQQMIHLWCAIF
jgi:hypothetical protein